MTTLAPAVPGSCPTTVRRAAPDAPAGLTPIDEYLAAGRAHRGRALRRAHDARCAGPATRSTATCSRPRPPGPGQQYAFEVDLDACTGCKACVTACHSLNGLDEGESWRRVGTAARRHRRARPVAADGDRPRATTASTRPASNGCPVDAYEKDPVTGHRPPPRRPVHRLQLLHAHVPLRGARSYNAALGIVRKCDMCSGPPGRRARRRRACRAARTARSRSPSSTSPRCVAATSQRRAARAGRAAVGDHRADDPLPLDAARSPRTSVAGRPSRRSVQSAPTTHPPLVGDARCSPSSSVGRRSSPTLLLAGRVGDAAPRALPTSGARGRCGTGRSACWRSARACCTSAARCYAWRAVIGLRHSWLSREIVAFGAFAALAAGATPRARRPRAGPTSARGARRCAVASSADWPASPARSMLYAVTRRPWWRVAGGPPGASGSPRIDRWACSSLARSHARRRCAADGADRGRSAVALGPGARRSRSRARSADASVLRTARRRDRHRRRRSRRDRAPAAATSCRWRRRPCGWRARRHGRCWRRRR